MNTTSGAPTFQQLIASNPTVLVDFYADWCGPCKMMKPILEELKRLMGEDVKIVKIDVDRNPAASGAFEIQGIPTLVLFRNGKQVWRQSGVVPAQQLQQIIQSHLDK